MKDPYEKGVANHPAPSLALTLARAAVKRRQGYRWAGLLSFEKLVQGAEAVFVAEGDVVWCASASARTTLRSLRPQTRLETKSAHRGHIKLPRHLCAVQ